LKSSRPSIFGRAKPGKRKERASEGGERSKLKGDGEVFRDDCRVDNRFDRKNWFY